MLVFLDLKSTGFELTDLICGVSILDAENLHTELINEGKKITSEASALHHISNKMIKNKPALQESSSFKYLSGLEKEDILVVHDFEYIERLLIPHGLELPNYIIDTKRVAKHLISDIERFDLQYLRYELSLIEDEDVIYKPLEDVVMIKSLFNYLLESVSHQQMFELSFQNVLLEKLSFGKYSGRYIEEIVHSDLQYIYWLLSLETLDADLKYTLEYYLQG